MKVGRMAEMIAGKYYRFKFKNRQVNFQSLADELGDCLVCMPENLQHMLPAASKLPDIAAIFPNRLIRVLVTSNIDHRSHEHIKHFTIDRPYSYDITSFYLPKKPFIERLKADNLAICIDLDFEHNFFNSAVCINTQAPLRIAARKGMGLPYYNLEIDIGDGETITADSYTNFINVLYNFRHKGETVAPLET
jgi:hypothetical protein